MKTLFIGKRRYTNRDALAERFGRIYRIPYHWAEAGHTCQLWLIDYHSRQFRRQRDGNLQVCSTPVLGTRFFGRLFGDVFGRVKRPDCVVASGDCYVGLLGFAVARATGASFVFDMYDKYDEFSGYARLPGLDPQTFLLRRAEVVTFASRALFSSLGDRARNPLVVPNGIDRDVFRPLDKHESRRRLGLPPNALLVGYFGSMEPERGVTDLIDAVERLREEGEPIELLIGGQAHLDVDLNRGCIRYLGNLAFDTVPVALASCDVLALPYRHSAFLDMASSCKIAEYLAANRPIVATETPNFSANFPVQAGELSGILARPGDGRDLARVLRRQVKERRVASLSEVLDWASVSRELAARLDQFLST